jgi:hypothetical protein
MKVNKILHKKMKSTESGPGIIKAIEDFKPSVFEYRGFQEDPSVAIAAGIAIGYRMGLKEAGEFLTKHNSQIGEKNG